MSKEESLDLYKRNCTHCRLCVLFKTALNNSTHLELIAIWDCRQENQFSYNEIIPPVWSEQIDQEIAAQSSQLLRACSLN